MNRWTRLYPPEDDTIALALIAEEQHGSVIKACNAVAAHAGIHMAMRLTDARTLWPNLQIAQHDKNGDTDFLHRLSLWAQRWGPWSAIDGDDGILIDVTGVPHLFGGVQSLCDDIAARFKAMNIEAQYAIAPNIGAAWALARYSSAGPIVKQTDLISALRPLPVSALRIDDKNITLLNRLGLKTIGALSEVPRTSLARRFRGAKSPYSNPLLRLDQVYGHIAETAAPITKDIPQRAFARVIEPILHTSILQPVLEKLAHELRESLARQHRGARRLIFCAYRVDGEIQQLQSELAQPTKDAAHMVKLFAPRLETLEAGFGFDSFALSAVWHEPLDNQQHDLSGEVPDHSALPRLIDRLSVRLGAQNIHRPIAVESHLPERAIAWGPALNMMQKPVQDNLPFHDRPIRLLDSPEYISVIYATPEGLPRLFKWRKNPHNIIKVSGPERIAPEWWREKSTARLRDYYKVEDEDGARFWIYRSGVIGDGRGGVPDWFLHGFFA